MEVAIGSRLSYKELQFKFDFCHGLLTFHELLPFVQNSFSGLFLAMLSYNILFKWKFLAILGMKSYRSSSTVVLQSLLFDRGKCTFETNKIFALDQSLPSFQRKQTCLAPR